MVEHHLHGVEHVWGPFGLALQFNSGLAFSLFTGRSTLVTVVLAVGARLSGQASSGTPISRCTVAMRASEESALPVRAIRGTPKRLMTGRMVRIS